MLVKRVLQTLTVILLGLFATSIYAEPVILSASGEPTLHGTRSVPRGLDMCNDYLSRTNYAGEPYRIVEADRVVTRHEGIDFCARAGTPVIAPLSGRITWVVHEDAIRGGQVLIDAGFRSRVTPGKAARRMYVGIVHMIPEKGLQAGNKVVAGQKIGTVHPAGPPEIGSRAHLHFTMRYCKEHTCHVDPNFYWQAGPGKITCFRSSSPPPKGRLVAPLAC